jgi:hypothetical protein
MRRLCPVLTALLLLAAGAAPAAWAAGPAGSARTREVSAERSPFDFKALLDRISEIFGKAFADEGPNIDPWGRTTVDTGPHIDPWGDGSH